MRPTSTRSYRNSFLSVLAISALTLLALLFQNCSQVNFRNLSSAASDLKLDNNGGGYGGKPSYYRLTPGFACEQNTSSPKASIEIQGPQFLLKENTRLACDAQGQLRDSNLIDTSIYQRDIVGYREGIFEGFDSTPQSIPANLVEVWCKDSNDENGIETISHYNRETKKAVTEIFYSVLGQKKKIPDFEVTRNYSSTQITLQNPINDDQFHLEVYRDQPAPTYGLFNGLLRGLINGQHVERKTYCRLGGLFDASIWPVAQVVDYPIESYKIAPDSSAYAFKTRFNSKTGGWNLFAGDMTGKRFQQVSPNLISSGLTNFEFTINSKSLVFWGDPQFANYSVLMQVPFDANADISTPQPPAKILSPLISGARGEDNIQFTPDGTRVVFGALIDGGTLSHNIQSIPLAGGDPVTLNLPVAKVDWDDTHEFAVSKTTSRVAYLAGVNQQSEFFLIDADGRNRIKPALGIPNADWMISNSFAPGNFIFLDEIQSVLVKTVRTSQGNPPFQNYLVSFDGSKIKPLPLNASFHSLSASGQDMLLAYCELTYNPVTHLADCISTYVTYNIASSISTPVPDITPMQFNATSTALLGYRTLPSKMQELVSLDLKSNQVSRICPEANAESLKMLEVAGGDLYMASLDLKNNSVHIFNKKPTSSCQLLTSLPARGQQLIQAIELSPDGFKMLVQLRTIINYRAQDRLMYVPLDGIDPSIEITAPVHARAGVEFAHFLKDSNSVFYIGDQLVSDIEHAFLWLIPQKK